VNVLLNVVVWDDWDADTPAEEVCDTPADEVCDTPAEVCSNTPPGILGVEEASATGQTVV
jgi:hypothetical protein